MVTRNDQLTMKCSAKTERKEKIKAKKCVDEVPKSEKQKRRGKGKGKGKKGKDGKPQKGKKGNAKSAVEKSPPGKRRKILVRSKESLTVEEEGSSKETTKRSKKSKGKKVEEPAHKEWEEDW